MKQEDLIKIVEELVPQPKELEFDKIGVVRPTPVDIKKVGVCVDLTDYVAEQARKLGVDFLIIHQGRGERTKILLEEMNIGGYGINLALDTSSNGLIETFASIFHIGFHLPLTLEYKGHDVERGAILLNTLRSGLSRFLDIGYFVSRYVDRNGLNFGILNIRLYNCQYLASSGIETVVVSTGRAVIPEFVEQVKHHEPQLFIAGSADTEAVKHAQKLGIAVMTIGDFESHHPGTISFAEKLSDLVERKGYHPHTKDYSGQIPIRDRQKAFAIYIPNYRI